MAIASDHGGLPIRDDLAQTIREAGELLSPDATAAEAVIAGAAKAGVDAAALAAELQTQGAASFDASFVKLLQSIESKVTALRAA